MWSFPYTLTRQWQLEDWPIEDAEIFACNGLAAELYGYASPAEMTGLLLSWTQPISDRRNGRFAYALRERGHEVATNYDALIERPDGEVIAVKKEVLEVPMTSAGQKVWATRLYPLKIAYTELPDLAPAFGVPESAIRADIGWTPQEVRNDPSIMDDWTITESFRTLIVEHQGLLSSPTGKRYSWARYKNRDKIKQLYTCPRQDCKNDWYGAMAHESPQCPSCRRKPKAQRVV